MKIYSRISLAIIIATTAFLFIPMSTHAHWVITQLTHNSYDDDHPAISNGYVVWEGWDGHDAEIFRNDGHTTEQLTDNPYYDALQRNDYAGQINSSGQVVWMGMLSGDGSGGANEIFRYDSSGTFRVTNDSYRDESPQINDNGKMVWRGIDGSDYHIFYYDGSTATNISNATCSSVSEWFQINSNGDVVWVGISLDGGGDSELFFYDGTDTSQITDNTYDDVTPRINENGLVVYVGKVGPSSAREEIFHYDGYNSFRLTNNSVIDYQPDINEKGHVVWSKQANIGYDVLFYDGSNIIQIANFAGGWGQPKISDTDFVVWQGVDPNNSSDNKLHVWDGQTITVLDSMATNDRYHQINTNGDIVWQAHDGNDYEIFLATRLTSPAYSCTGFEPPCDSPDVAITAKKNKCIPLKTELNDENGAPITDSDLESPPVLVLVSFSGAAIPSDAATVDGLPPSQATDGNQFEFIGGRWCFNLKIKDHYTAQGTYTFKMATGDSEEYIIEPTCTVTIVVEK